MGGAALRCINTNKNKIIAANAGRQLSNEQVERTWRALIQMTRTYITKKQVGRELLFCSIAHAASMLNQIPDRLGRKLYTPFQLVHVTKLDFRTWF